MKIAITHRDTHSPTCEQWLQAAAEDTTEIIDISLCSSIEHMEQELQTCDGIIFTGGEPLAVLHYDKETPVVGMQRDMVEFKAFDKALSLNMPILGIGRGMRLINVALGGMVYTPRTAQLQEAEQDSGEHELRPLVITPGSLLVKITGELEGDVASLHEQAIEQLAGDLTEAATSPDGMIEAIEWATPQSRPFLFAMAWHPERMAYSSAFSLALAKHFLFEAAAYEALVKS